MFERKASVIHIFVAVLLSMMLQQAYAFQDPTRPVGAVAVKSKRQSLKLESVLVSGDRRVAVINGKSYQPGDKVGGALLHSINKRSVILRRGNQQQTLTLFKKIVNK